MSDRLQYVQALSRQLATSVNDAFTNLHQQVPNATPAQQALHLDQFAMACAALKEGFEILGQRAAAAAEELLDDEPD
jgi:uncharacterized protein with von Willebrand factor type A (vWA) domain